jgi:hypothetical protein
VTASHHILTNTLLTKKAFYGAGCSESMQIMFLRKQVDRSIARYLIRTLSDVLRAQYNQSIMIDRIHGHLWLMFDHDQISQTCACELYRSNNRFQDEWKQWLVSIDDDNEETHDTIDNTHDIIFQRQTSAKYLDSFLMKTHTFKIAIETAINLQLTTICL